ncbi:MAG TPA: 30S ribosome-binding factor RbfA [Candidatus Moranbacteria bacterium]|nr:MAG: Ribosome-binding factor A [Candidatus Moranbacteria bacterium GW2011_GWF1_34_10]HBI17519.1 30S ribosome-binding factor RbfA [Candidatus Moranbacteria bacterium]
MSFRMQKVNSLIREQLGEILSRELDLKPGVFLTVFKVDTTNDLRYANVFVSVFPEKEGDYVMTALKNEKSNIQRILNKKLHMKVLPKLVFKLDKTEVEADEIEKILKQIENE